MGSVLAPEYAFLLAFSLSLPGICLIIVVSSCETLIEGVCVQISVWFHNVANCHKKLVRGSNITICKYFTMNSIFVISEYDDGRSLAPRHPLTLLSSALLNDWVLNIRYSCDTGKDYTHTYSDIYATIFKREKGIYVAFIIL